MRSTIHQHVSTAGEELLTPATMSGAMGSAATAMGAKRLAGLVANGLRALCISQGERALGRR
jgi:hypothetical protein